MKNSANLITKIEATSTNLNKLLLDEGSELLLGLKKDVQCKIKLDELRRLIVTLNQYSHKSKNLVYIGLLGHFSSGKSSTINSILNMWETKDERSTGLHPTDVAVTLTTHRDNQGSLLGTHRVGELKVGTQYIDTELLKDKVLVDTPGSGDPIIIEEMVRDFLPICDYLIYIFAATNPLDTNDIPVLKKAHEELPFIPMKFIITRADEFIDDRSKGFSKDNVSLHKILNFTSELIARLQHIVPSRQFTEKDFLFIDNIYRYNTHLISNYVFSQNTTLSLHDHKINYFMNNAKRIRDFFEKYIREQIYSLETLVTIASQNDDKYRTSVQMGKSNLTENWISIHDEFEKAYKQMQIKADGFISKAYVPSSIQDTITLKKYEKKIKLEISKSLDRHVDRIVERISVTVDSLVSPIQQSIRERIVSAEENDIPFDDINVSDLSILSFENAISYPYESASFPYELSAEMDELENHLEAEIKQYEDNINSTNEYLTQSTRNNPFILLEERLTSESQEELILILEEFYRNVELYKGAILAIDARDIAEKLRMGRIIDKLDNINLTERYKGDAKNELFRAIYFGRNDYIEKYTEELKNIQEHIVAPAVKTYEKTQRAEPFDYVDKVQKIIDESIHEDSIRRQALSQAKSLVTTHQKLSRDNIIQEKENLRKRILKRTLAAAVFGFAIGTLLLLTDNSLSIQLPFLDKIISNSLGNAILTEAFFALITTGASLLSDDQRKGAEKAIKSIPDREKSELIKNIDDMSLSKSSIIGAQKPQIQRKLLRLWTEITQHAENHAIQNFQEEYKSVYNQSVISIKNNNDYKDSSVMFFKSIMKFYEDTEKNLNILTGVSDKIKKDAIEPSFKSFTTRQEDLKTFYEKIKNIEFL